MGYMTREQKKHIVNNLKSQLEDAQITLVADYRGTNVNDIVGFRKELTAADSSALVCKNTLAKIAFSDLDITVPDGVLSGPSIIINSSENAVRVSKSVVDFMKTHENFQLKGGFLDRKSITEQEVRTLAALPSREELIAKVIYMLKSPISRLVGSLSSPTTGLILTLKAIQEKKQEE